MKALTRNFLRSKFREYYLEEPISPPPGLESREWGLILFDDVGMRRHKSFLNRGEMVDYIRSMVPSHLYHSAAYYRLPSAPTMKEKDWQGADLIFDLDADHLKRAPKSYGDMLELVKKETEKLLNFLLSDFGFSEDKVSVVFSGGRGYHIHIRDERVWTLGSDERREAVDYLTGRGLDLESLISKRVITGDAGVDKVLVLRCPPQDAPGWGGRLNLAIQSFIEDISERDEEEAISLLSTVKGIGAVNSTKFYSYLKAKGVIEQIRQGNLDGAAGISGIWNIFARYISDQSVQIGPGYVLDGARGETDEPVTADVKRLIRFPGSLHGGSGFRVTPLSVAELEEFDPLFDALAFGDSPVPVQVSKPSLLEMRGERYNLEEGREELPAYAAVFLMARGLAELGKALER